MSDDDRNFGITALDDGAGARYAAVVTGLDEALQRRLAHISRIRTVTEGEILVREAEVSSEVGYLIDGTLLMKRTQTNGMSGVSGILVPSDLFGWISSRKSDFEIEALTSARLFCMERAGFEQALEHLPEVEHAFLTGEIDALAASRDWILLLGSRNSHVRIATFLVILSRRRVASASVDGTANLGPIAVPFPVDPSRISRYLGMTAADFDGALRVLEDSGIVALSRPGKIEIRDVPRLVQLTRPRLMDPPRGLGKDAPPDPAG